jgi:hypothetical protein
VTEHEEEVAAGQEENLPAPRRKFKLTSSSRMVAFFDAQGTRTAKDIAAITGINHSTIHRWRGEAEYKEAVTDWQNQIAADLQPMMQAILSTYAGLVKKAAKEIERKLEATDPNSGLPNEGVRASALKILFDSPMVKTAVAAAGIDTGAEGGEAPAAPIQLHVHLGADGQVVDAQEAEFTELGDDADG